MNFTKEAILDRLISSYTGPGSAEEGTFAGDVLRACADMLAEFWSTAVDGLEYRAFVSTAAGDWLTRVCADRGVDRREGESDEDLRKRALEALARQPASGNADHYAAWCAGVADILRVRVLPLARGAGTVDIVAVDLRGRCPEQSVLDEAQAIVEAQRPIGADARVVGAEEIPLAVSASVLFADGADIEAAQASFAARLDAFCRESALRDSTVSLAKVLQLLLETDGVADIAALTLNGSLSSLTLTQTQIPVPGAVSLTEVAE